MRRFILILIASLALVACDRGEFGKRAQGDALSGDPTQVGNNQVDEDAANNANSPPILSGGNNANNVFDPVNAPERQTELDLADATHRVGLSAYRSQAMLGDNVAVSALGLTKSIVISTLGASADSMAELESVLGVSADAATLNFSMTVLEADLTLAVEPGVARVVPSVWAQSDAAFSNTFLNDLAYYHGLDMRLVNFRAPEAARLQINNWYRSQTQGFVTEAVAPRGISEAAQVAFVDATFFSGAWANGFDRDLTQNAEFRGQTPRTIPFMQREDFTLIERTDAYDAVVLPYAGQLALVAVMPKEGAFTQVEDDLDETFFQDVVVASEPEFVMLKFPKVSVDGRIDSSSSVDLGLEATQGSAAFKDIADGLGAGAYAQRTRLAFTELGTEGSAGSPDPSPPMDNADAGELSFDRPFIFAIVDTGTNAMVYVGRVVR